MVEGTFPESLHYVVVMYSIPLHVHVRPHLLSLVALKSHPLVIIESLVADLLTTASYQYTKIISFLNYVFAFLFY